MIEVPVKESNKDTLAEKLKKELKDYKNIIDGLDNKNSKLQNNNNEIKKYLEKMTQNLMNIR